jgi:hypothetical protein
LRSSAESLLHTLFISYPEDYFDKGLCVVQLKRALRGLAFTRGALCNISVSSDVPKAVIKSLRATLDGLETDVFLELGRARGVGVSAALGSTSQRLRLISNSTPQQTAPRGRDSIAQGASPASRSGTEPKAPKGARRECRGCGQWNLALLGLARFIDDCTHGSAARRPELSNLAHFGAGQSRIMKGR